ncbi:MAG: DUF4856 domain-containing protein [Myxococcota bacterium]
MTFRARSLSRTLLVLCVAGSAATACAPQFPAGGQPVPGVDSGEVPPTTYAFASRFGEGSSVAYSGQVQRHLLLDDLAAFIGALREDDYLGETAEQVRDDLDFFFDYKNQGGAGDDPIRVAPAGGGVFLQETYGEVGAPASLREKLPDQDLGSTTPVIGVGDGSQLPTAVVEGWLTELGNLVIERSEGRVPKDPSGADIVPAFVTADGRDLQELTQKFLLGAVAFSQCAGDYLADGPEGKGLASDNVQQVDGQPYTVLEHHWDEGFGYFGAARDLLHYTVDERAGVDGRADYRYGYHDTNADGRIDATGEYNFGPARYAAKRDLATRGGSETDFAAEAFQAFVDGRHLITSAGGALTEVQATTLKGLRDSAISAWEKAIAASAVHYLNEVLEDMDRFATLCDDDSSKECYRFLDYAAHWSELKGFALSLQFNPRSPLSSTQHTTLQGLIGSSPVLPGAEETMISAYRADLLTARGLLGDVFAFDAVNLQTW